MQTHLLLNMYKFSFENFSEQLNFCNLLDLLPGNLEQPLESDLF